MRNGVISNRTVTRWVNLGRSSRKTEAVRRRTSISHDSAACTRPSPHRGVFPINLLYGRLFPASVVKNSPAAPCSSLSERFEPAPKMSYFLLIWISNFQVQPDGAMLMSFKYVHGREPGKFSRTYACSEETATAQTCGKMVRNSGQSVSRAVFRQAED